MRTIALTMLLAAALMFAACSSSFEEEYELFRSITVGTKEEAVVARLGQPTRVFNVADAPKDYYIPGYAKEEREISNKVLIYIGSEPIAYIYIDNKGLVEHVFVGGS
jgi:hypothetical protein